VHASRYASGVVDVPEQGTAAGLAAAQPVPVGLDDADLVTPLPGAVIAVDMAGRVVHWSAGAEALYGFTPSEAFGRSVRSLIQLAPERADEVAAATHGGEQWQGEFRTVRKDGTPLLVYVSNAPVHGPGGDVVGVVGVSLDITAYSAALSARAEQLSAARADAERLADRNARLVQVSEALGASLDARAVADVVVAQAVEGLQLHAGGLLVVDEGRLRVLSVVGYEPEVVRTYEALPLEALSPLTDLLREGVPMRTGRREELVERYPSLPHSSSSESFAGIPLELEGRVLGVMALSSTRPSAFPDEDLDFLLTLGRQAAQALDRGRLFAAEREARRRMSFLAMASSRLAESLDVHQTLDAVAALAVPAAGDWCSIHLLDESGAPQLVTVHHRDAALQELLTELFVRYPPDPGRGAGIGQAVGEARTVHHAAFPDEVVRATRVTPGTTTRCAGWASAAPSSCRCASSAARSAS
jgi:PAS domain S-box-containing protein